MNLDKIIKSRKIKIVIVLFIFILSIGILGTFALDGLNETNIEDNEYDIEYIDDNSIIITQNEGDSKELNVKLTYNDDFTLNESVTLHGKNDNYYLSINERNNNYIQHVELSTIEEEIVLKESEIEMKHIEDFNINNLSKNNNEPIKLAASDYISDRQNIESYSWDINNNLILEGESIILSSIEQSQYTVSLTIEDRYGNMKSDEFIINIDGNSNNITANPNIHSSVGETIKFTGENSISNTDVDIESYEWDFGDGTIQEGERVEHEYSEGGHYNVSLITTDINGESNREDIELVISSEIVSNLTISDNDGFSYTFDASDSEFGDDLDNITYYWSFGDGETETTTEPLVNHTYSEPDDYSVTLVISSDQGFESTSQISVNPVVYLEFADDTPLRVLNVNNNYEDIVMPEHELGEEWPEIVFIEDARYEFRNLPSNVELIGENEDDILLSQVQTGSFEDDEKVDWMDDGDSIEFTVTSELGEELFGYKALE